jgi:hypothetical protein
MHFDVQYLKTHIIDLGYKSVPMDDQKIDLYILSGLLRIQIRFILNGWIRCKMNRIQVTEKVL